MDNNIDMFIERAREGVDAFYQAVDEDSDSTVSLLLKASDAIRKQEVLIKLLLEKLNK